VLDFLVGVQALGNGVPSGVTPRGGKNRIEDRKRRRVLRSKHSPILGDGLGGRKAENLRLEKGKQRPVKYRNKTNRCIIPTQYERVEGLGIRGEKKKITSDGTEKVPLTRNEIP